MALVLKDRVQETTTTTGTGTLTLAGAVTGFQSFSVIGDGNTTYYTITSDTDFEVGIGTYTATGTLLSRDTILESSNSGNVVNFGAGAKIVFLTYPAERAVDTNIVQTLTNKTIDGTSNTLTNISVASGGTGTSTLTANNVILGNGTSAPLFVAPSTAGNVLTSNGTTWTSTAPAGIAEIRAPVITSPANNATGVSLTPTINGSVFAPAYSVDTRDYRQLQIDIAAGDFTSPVVDQQENANNITVSTPLTQTTAFKARIRDVATTGVSSAFSSLINFTTLTQTVPDAPTIGTATQTGATTATVAFTAPANNGGSTITSYTATSSPAGGTGTLNQAGSGTISVTGLTGGTAYTFTVRATNAVGQGPASAASNSVTTSLVIGQSFGGGFFAGQIGVSSVATHNLVVGPRSTAQFQEQWKTSPTSTAGTNSVIDGPANTSAMIAAGASDHPCGQFCNNLVTGGFSDWYMPAPNELEVCYFNLKPTTDDNNTSSGINANAVPARASNYTAGNPAQTSVAAFQTGGSEAFENFFYWSSMQQDAGDARAQRFSTGQQFNTYYKGSNVRVRAIRRVAV